MSQTHTKTVTGEEAKKVSKYFLYGNIAAILIPFPLFILWFGASIFVYAMFRHFPHPKVGYYTQIAAYHYYGLAGFLVPILTFVPGSFFLEYWWALWIGCAAVLIPLSILLLLKINKDNWEDIEAIT